MIVSGMLAANPGQFMSMSGAICFVQNKSVHPETAQSVIAAPIFHPTWAGKLYSFPS